MNILVLVVWEGRLLLQVMRPFIENHIVTHYDLLGNKIIEAVTLCLFTVSQENTFLALQFPFGPIGIRDMHKTVIAKNYV